MSAEDLNRVIEELRAGEEPETGDETETSPGGLLWRLHRMSRDDRLELLGALLEAARRGEECEELGHEWNLKVRARLIRSLTTGPEVQPQPCGQVWMEGCMEFLCIAPLGPDGFHAGEHYAYVGSGW